MADKQIAIQFDVSTQNFIEREITSDEIADIKKINDELESEQKTRESKIAAKQTALAKLAKLGLTEEEISAL